MTLSREPLAMLRQFIVRFIGDSSGEMLAAIAKSAAYVCVFSVGAAYLLADRIDADRTVLNQLAAAAGVPGSKAATARSGVDMSTTGSLTLNQQRLRIDPCGEPVKR
jgi:hypothetical protein